MQQLHDPPLVRPADLNQIFNPAPPVTAIQPPRALSDLTDDDVTMLMGRFQQQADRRNQVTLSEGLVNDLIAARSQLPKRDPLTVGLWCGAAAIWVMIAGTYFFRSPEQVTVSQNQQLIEGLTQQNQQLMAENQRLATQNTRLAAEALKQKDCIGLCIR